MLSSHRDRSKQTACLADVLISDCFSTLAQRSRTRVAKVITGVVNSGLADRRSRAPVRIPSRDARRSRSPSQPLGLALAVSAVLANQRWLDRHFLPSWFLPHRWYVLIESSVRVTIAAAGVVARAHRAGARRRARSRQRPGACSSSRSCAAVLAFGAGELVLRRVHLRAAEWLVPDEEPRRRVDARLGWTFVPARTGHSTIGSRVVDYAFDPAGYRVRRVDEPVDPDRPTIVFVGESVMFGEGLTWEESVPAQVGAMTGIQSANLAVHGFSTDQAYLRLETELPRFRRPVAVVSLFMTALFGRNLDDDRPHLGAGPGLAAGATARADRLAGQAARAVPDRRDGRARHHR